MSNIKTGLMFSPLTENIYWGKMNTKTGVAIGNNKKDVTSEFIGIMLQKFEINTSQNIERNGNVEAVVIVVDEEKSKKYLRVNEMLEVLETISQCSLLKKIDLGDGMSLDVEEIKSLVKSSKGEV